MIQAVFTGISWVVVVVLKPFKTFAFRTRFGFLKRLILEVTSAIDFVLLWVNVQNETQLLHASVYGGHYVFGKCVMITDHATASVEMALPSVRGNRFMGVHIVGSSTEVFATNSPMINMGQPIRRLAREYMDREVLPPAIKELGYDEVRSQCAEILAEWRADPRMTKHLVMRSAVTRVIVRVVSGVTITKEESESVTWAYFRRFGEMSALGRYFPSMVGLLGSKAAIRRDAYFVLRRYGIDNLAIDAALFAAMFSIGTLIQRCVGDIPRYGIDYASLDSEGRAAFIHESIRLYPTVTTTHRIVEEAREIEVAGKRLRLEPGDEVAYPIICLNRDPAVFDEPEAMKLDRPQAERDAVLSWSVGPHDCPAKALSLVVTRVLLDEMGEATDLRELRYWRSAV